MGSEMCIRDSVVDGPQGRYSWFFQNSVSAVDIDIPIVVDGVDYGAPAANLERAMQQAGLTSVDLWIGTAVSDVARRLLPILKPKAYLPVHWDSFFTPFESGPDAPYRNTLLEPMLAEAGILLVRPVQYMDKWRLSAAGVVSVPNAGVQGQLGFKSP